MQLPIIAIVTNTPLERSYLEFSDVYDLMQAMLPVLTY
jgi:hypothetical protein